eukprot:SAG31_NODE_17_length_35773_cov_25.999271_18_plen_87_part_00
MNGTAVVNTTARNDSIKWCEQHGLDVIIKYNEVFGGSSIHGSSEIGSDSPAVLGLNGESTAKFSMHGHRTILLKCSYSPFQLARLA